MKTTAARDTSPDPGRPDDIRIDMLSPATSESHLLPASSSSSSIHPTSSSSAAAAASAAGPSTALTTSSSVTPTPYDRHTASPTSASIDPESFNAAAAIMAAGKRSRQISSNTASDMESDDEFKDRDVFEGAAHVHYVHRAPWLRAAVLGANDGLVSTASVMLGVGAASPSSILLAGVVGLVGGAMSMGIGEYVSVSSQRDTEKSDIERERAEHAKGPETLKREIEELVRIYMSRGLSRKLAKKVVKELHAGDAVAAHVRDELGIDVNDLANPWTAGMSSMAAYVVGAAWPVLVTALIREDGWQRPVGVVVISMVMLAVFGAVGAYVGGASLWRAALRVWIGGTFALGVAYGTGKAADKFI